MSAAIQTAESPDALGCQVIRDTYAQKTALRLGVSIESVRQEFKKKPSSSPSAREDSPDEPAADMPRPSAQEAGLLRVLLENDSFVEWTAAHLDLEWLAHPVVREIATRRLSLEQTQAWQGMAAWLSEMENATWKNLITELLVDNRPLPAPEILLKGSSTRDGVVKNLRDTFIDRQLAALNQRFESGALDDAATVELLQKKAQLNKLKQQPLVPRTPEISNRPEPAENDAI